MKNATTVYTWEPSKPWIAFKTPITTREAATSELAHAALDSSPAVTCWDCRGTGISGYAPGHSMPSAGEIIDEIFGEAGGDQDVGAVVRAMKRVYDDGRWNASEIRQVLEAIELPPEEPDE